MGILSSIKPENFSTGRPLQILRKILNDVHQAKITLYLIEVFNVEINYM
jgi:hypothetical protein